MLPVTRCASGPDPPWTLGFGAASIGNLYREVAEENALEAVDAAWEAGIRYFDTAPHYGLGLSERRLGAALASRPRSGFVVSTKVGRLLVPSHEGGSDISAGGYAVPADYRRQWDFSADGVKLSLESSLQRLRMDRADIVFLHDPDDHWTEAVSQAYPALADLRAQGVIGKIGVGMNQWQMLSRFVDETDIDLVMLAGRYTLLEQPALQVLLPRCVQRGVSVIAVGVFNSGLMAQSDVPDDARYNYAAAPKSLIDRARLLAATCRRHGVELPHAALQFPLAHPAVGGIAVGMRTSAHVLQCAEWLRQPLPTSLWEDFREKGLLASEVPVPSLEMVNSGYRTATAVPPLRTDL